MNGEERKGPERIVGPEEEYTERMSPFWEDGGQPEPGRKKKEDPVCCPLIQYTH